jgi:hypothetical protein
MNLISGWGHGVGGRKFLRAIGCSLGLRPRWPSLSCRCVGRLEKDVGLAVGFLWHCGGGYVCQGAALFAFSQCLESDAHGRFLGAVLFLWYPSVEEDGPPLKARHFCVEQVEIFCSFRSQRSRVRLKGLRRQMLCSASCSFCLVRPPQLAHSVSSLRLRPQSLRYSARQGA